MQGKKRKNNFYIQILCTFSLFCLNFEYVQNGPQIPLTPVVLIPGDGGSRIQAKLRDKKSLPHSFCRSTTAQGFFELWLNIRLFTPGYIDCWADNLKLSIDEHSGRSMPEQGVETYVPGFGGTETVEWLDSSEHNSSTAYFAPIVKTLVFWGYRRGENVVGAPYDFRKSSIELGDYFIRLRQLIEQTYRNNGEQPVVILAHSLGNLMVNHFFQNYVDKAWKETFIRAHFSLAAPWAGTIQTLRLFTSGYPTFGIPLPPLDLARIQKTFTSSSYLLPSRAVWPAHVDEVIASVGSINYTTADFEQFFTDADYPVGWLQYLTAHDPSVLKAPGVELYCVYGTGVDTPEQLHWLDGDFEKQPTVVYGNGDGTVNYRSLEFCKRWSDRNGGREKAVFVVEFAGVNHSNILIEPKMYSLLRSLLFRSEIKNEQTANNETTRGEFVVLAQAVNRLTSANLYE